MNQHGEIIFSWINNVFTLEVKGSFNEEALHHYTPLIQAAISKRLEKNWNRLEVWDDEVLGSPDTASLTKSLWQWYDQNGCVLTAIVTSNQVQAFGIKNMLSDRAEVFSDISEAHNWLETHKPIKHD